MHLKVSQAKTKYILILDKLFTNALCYFLSDIIFAAI